MWAGPKSIIYKISPHVLNIDAERVCDTSSLAIYKLVSYKSNLNEVKDKLKLSLHSCEKDNIDIYIYI